MYSSLEIKKDTIIVNTGDAEFHPSTVTINGRNYLRELKPNPRTPLFETIDGRNIYEGDSVVCVNRDWEILSKDNMTEKLYDYLKDKLEFFGFMKEAVNYKRMNEPCFSVNDVNDINELSKCASWNEGIRLHLINVMDKYKKTINK